MPHYLIWKQFRCIQIYPMQPCMWKEKSILHDVKNVSINMIKIKLLCILFSQGFRFPLGHFIPQNSQFDSIIITSKGGEICPKVSISTSSKLYLLLHGFAILLFQAFINIHDVFVSNHLWCLFVHEPTAPSVIHQITLTRSRRHVKIASHSSLTSVLW